MFGEDEAPIWGELMARSRRLGLNLATMDGLIAATALAHQFSLATRNRKHFDGLGLTLIDPWAG
jgi:predicted nucleic acid-binding protein